MMVGDEYSSKYPPRIIAFHIIAAQMIALKGYSISLKKAPYMGTRMWVSTFHFRDIICVFILMMVGDE
jgi:hypothetical protein